MNKKIKNKQIVKQLFYTNSKLKIKINISILFYFFKKCIKIFAERIILEGKIVKMKSIDIGKIDTCCVSASAFSPTQISLKFSKISSKIYGCHFGIPAV